MQAILSRRSIRKYTGKAVSETLINELLQAAMSAPSAGNQQPWHFVVLTDHSLMDQVPQFHPYSTMLKEAALAILVCGDERLQRYEGYWIQDCSAATENLLIAARANGLGAVWLGIYPRPERVDGMRKLLNIPHEITPFALISIGYPAEEKLPASRFDSARIHKNRW
ncbi:nitroreductase family protein [candidate division KSB1 bacterium]|nr:nitroreductase family protein [candidate division KSB1 bacterium]